MKDSVFFVSDVHIGSHYSKVHPNRISHFCDFLTQIQNKASHLFILGDLFEFWMEYRHYIPKEHFDVLVNLRNLVQSGTQVHYASGNHDFNLGHFFQQEMGIHVHLQPFKLKLQGKQLLLLHGDGIAASDWKYRVVKKILVHPISNFCFKLLHPDWGMNLAKLVGRLSRDANHSEDSSFEEYDQAASELLTEEIDAVLHGHTHRLVHKKWANGEYINTGEWFRRMEYAKLESGVFSIHNFQPHKRIEPTSCEDSVQPL